MSFWPFSVSERRTFFDWKKEPDLEALRAAELEMDNDTSSGLKLFESLADKGSIAAMLSIAGYWSDIRPAQLEKAKPWYVKAMNLGNTFAVHRIASILEEEKFYAEAKQLFEINANTNFGPSIYRLGMIYKFGLGEDIDLDKAVYFLSAASKKGHIYAKLQLSNVFLRKKGFRNKLRGLLIRVDGIFYVLSVLFRSTPSWELDEKRLI